jgi:hypothetical protein
MILSTTEYYADSAAEGQRLMDSFILNCIFDGQSCAQTLVGSIVIKLFKKIQIIYLCQANPILITNEKYGDCFTFGSPFDSVRWGELIREWNTTVQSTSFNATGKSPWKTRNVGSNYGLQLTLDLQTPLCYLCLVSLIL